MIFVPSLCSSWLLSDSQLPKRAKRDEIVGLTNYSSYLSIRDLMTPALLHHLQTQLSVEPTSSDWRAFTQRCEAHAPHLRALLFSLYGQRDDFQEHYMALITLAAKSWLARSQDLKTLDAAREADPRWFQSEKSMGGIAYVDLFAQNTDGVNPPRARECGDGLHHVWSHGEGAVV